jgi:hypothetical protein
VANSRFNCRSEGYKGYCGEQLDKYLILNLTTVNEVL